MDLTRSSQVVATVPGKGDQILQNAIDSFRTVLTPEQLAEFNSIQSVPDTDAVLIFTAELDLRRRSQKGKSIASRLFPVLQAVHNFTAVIDTFISSNPTIAALVWGSVKLTMQQAFESNLQELRDYSKNVKEEIRLAQAQSEYRNRELQRIEQDQAEKSRLSLGRFMSRTRDDFDTMRQSQVLRNQQLEREKNQKLLDSLSSHDYLKPLKQARQKRYPQSADWIFDTGEFKRWAEGTAARFLWCSGKSSGIRKDNLSGECNRLSLTKPSQAGSRVTFFFSGFDESESLTAETTLRAIAKQLIYPRDISDYIKQALEKVQNANGEVLSQVSELFIHLLSKGSRTTWIILDGLDEFPRDERRKLIDVLGSILLVPEVKMFATGRDQADSILARANPGLERLSMNCPLGKSGMEELVNQAVQNCLDAEELLVSDKELIAEIKNTLTQNANGMHVVLWVALVLRDICTQPNNEMVRKAIAVGNLPRSLTNVFNRALERIISTGGERVTQALLPWIVAAKQPLTLPQLQECCFISILQKHSMKDRYINGIQRLDAWFQGLVEIDHETKTVHLVHASVQQFFQTVPDKPNLAKFHVQAKEADLHLGEICVTYLNFNDFKTTLSRRRPPLPPMAPDEICAQALSLVGEELPTSMELLLHMQERLMQQSKRR
ncbi:Vegetative incompatibility protein HET-E-1 [Fusarium oxysporum f. sp. raphani]|uniref:Vegetative incompatibility protein HET-E-1 n=1 Tax=Fusarium oxysporum f. sp. raphani TaxID=96318 RepID=A0A8J5QCH3_FUSOX|nr:Vegetative incompatibility protein HET-E-1 [Fusarium oxysporum f. sp. raphani]